MNKAHLVVRTRPFVQGAVLLALCLLPWLHSLGWHEVLGNFYAWNLAGLPLADPLGLLQTLAAGGWPGWRLWAGALTVLALALVLGRVFCGWICPYGALSHWLWIWTHRDKKPHSRAGTNTWLPRLLLTVLGLVVAATLGAPVLNTISAPGLLSLAPGLTMETWGIAPSGEDIFTLLPLVLVPPLTLVAPVALLLGAEMLTGRRFWCRHVCPQALALMAGACLGGKVLGRAGLGLRWTKECCSCHSEEPCAAACSLDLRPRGKGPSRVQCHHCGACVGVCARHGQALELGITVTKEPHARQ